LPLAELKKIFIYPDMLPIIISSLSSPFISAIKKELEDIPLKSYSSLMENFGHGSNKKNETYYYYCI